MSLLSIGVSGLLANKQAINTVANNIANVNTEGYSRQSDIFVTRDPDELSGGFIGRGTDIIPTRRIVDQFVNLDILRNKSLEGQFSSIQLKAAQADFVLSDATLGLTGNLQAFFESLNSLAGDPASISTRQVVLNESSALINRFNQLDVQLTQTSDVINLETDEIVKQITRISNSIAELNKKLTNTGGRANDLLDRREQLVRDLSEFVPVSVTEISDGSINVLIGKGQSLVNGPQSAILSTRNAPTDPQKRDIFLSFGSASTNITNAINGGKLGGLLEVRKDILDPARNKLGLLAIAVSEQINAQHRLGLDLGSEIGGLFFGDVNGGARPGDRVIPNQLNPAGSSTLGVSISDASMLTTDEFQLNFNSTGTTYTLTNLTTNQIVDTFLPSDIPRTVAGLGFTITGSGGVASTAAPANTGSGAIGPIALTSLVAGPAMASNLTVTFNAGANQFDVTDPVGLPLGTIPYNPATDSGMPVTFSLAGFGDLTFTPTGTPTDTDVFTFSNNATGVPNPQAGERFLLQPTRLGATQINLAITSTQDIAAALNEFLTESTRTNTGSGTLGAVTLSNTIMGGATPGDILLTFDAMAGPPTEFIVTDRQNNPLIPPQANIPYDPLVDSGNTFTLSFAGFGDVSFTISGTPVDTDSFVIDHNDAANNDNRNAVNMADLQTTRFLQNGTLTFQQDYAQLVAQVGSDTSQAEVNQGASKLALNSAEARRESISGVNLDEEAANLIRFQQAFQASARAIAVADILFTTLLNAAGG